MNVRFTPDAARHADFIDAWWRENRPDSPVLFARELAAATGLLSASPKIGTIYTMLDGEPVRKHVMRRTRHHIYYAIDEPADELVILAVWGTPKKNGPPL